MCLRDWALLNLLSHIRIIVSMYHPAFSIELQIIRIILADFACKFECRNFDNEPTLLFFGR